MSPTQEHDPGHDEPEGDGNGWVISAGGARRWGRFGAAGLLLRAPDPSDPSTPVVLLQHRAVWTASGDTWALPGGARDSHEDAAAAALRETLEEAGIHAADVTVRAERVTSRSAGTVWHRPGVDGRHLARLLRSLRPDQHRPDQHRPDQHRPDQHRPDQHRPDQHGADQGAPAREPVELPPLVQLSPDEVEWTYTTVVADARHPLDTVANNESLELRWVREDEVSALPLMPAFAEAWGAGLRAEPVELVVDVANVLGSRPDDWWRDRAGSTGRLLDELDAGLPRTVELPGGFGWTAGVHAVVEGAARQVRHDGTLRLRRAAGSGDDEVVSVAEELASSGRRVLVVTADRGLRSRLAGTALVTGPRTLLG